MYGMYAKFKDPLYVGMGYIDSVLCDSFSANLTQNSRVHISAKTKRKTSGLYLTELQIT